MRVIDAEELFNRVGQIKPKNKQQYEDIGMFMNMITNSNTVERRHKGHWIRCDILQEFKCSECRMCFKNKSNPCPNCGTEMESDE